jgi:hypothetical protein
MACSDELLKGFCRGAFFSMIHARRQFMVSVDATVRNVWCRMRRKHCNGMQLYTSQFFVLTIIIIPNSNSAIFRQYRNYENAAFSTLRASVFRAPIIGEFSHDFVHNYLLVRKAFSVRGVIWPAEADEGNKWRLSSHIWQVIRH